MNTEELNAEVERLNSELTEARELIAAQGKVIEWAMGDAFVDLRAHQSAPAARAKCQGHVFVYGSCAHCGEAFDRAPAAKGEGDE